ncbi:MAG: nucleotidyltransferase domain-containing protein [Pseudomonas sp.]|nr:nucleotidyltransferase domain-containing protein [Pseudomonas sp.]
MRLSKTQQSTIKELAIEVFDEEVSVHLFGSRTNDQARGGDIDLLIVADHLVTDKVRKIIRLNAKLQMALGEQKFDIVVKDSGTMVTPFHLHILDSAIRL